MVAYVLLYGWLYWLTSCVSNDKEEERRWRDLTNIMIEVPKLLHRPDIHFGKGERRMVVDAIVIPKFKNGRLWATEADDVNISL